MQQIYTVGKFEFRWLPMLEGCHEGRTLPETVFIDPGYTSWLINENKFNKRAKYSKELFKQAQTIDVLTRNILPAEAPRSHYEFLVLKDRKDRLAEVITVEVGEQLPYDYERKYRLAERRATLDVNIFNNYYDPVVSSRNMALSLRRILFPYLDREPMKRDFELVMLTRSNFARPPSPQRAIPLLFG